MPVIEVIKPGMFTTVQDLGRFRSQMQGVPVAGAMDSAALRLGNILLGNDENAAGLEVTITGPTLKVITGECCCAITGAEVGVTKNGLPISNWTVHKIVTGDEISFSPPPQNGGVRAYFCVSSGFEVPLSMGSRSTYTRGGFGGHKGRALKAEDVLRTVDPGVLSGEHEGFVCPPRLRPDRNPGAPLRVMPGQQEEAFTEEGIETFYSSEYVITNSADRMGYRMEGAAIAHREGADIISDGICLGSVQVPGHGQPIVMLADRQTTGGYTKIGVVCTVDLGKLAQRLPGQKVRFVKTTLAEAVSFLQQEATLFNSLKELRADWRRIPQVKENHVPAAETRSICVTVNGKTHSVLWEVLN
ncbi:MAG: biotin-dependent carboxyltransferase family protein [Synergistaceae bacterium]|nr:biotin-dependent carboxyltransferase family protein [Synergistaceae bacterium]